MKTKKRTPSHLGVRFVSVPVGIHGLAGKRGVQLLLLAGGEGDVPVHLGEDFLIVLVVHEQGNMTVERLAFMIVAGIDDDVGILLIL